MPISSTRLRCRGGTADRPISSTNTNRLSRDRLYSVSQPAKNWLDARAPAVAPTATPNSAPSATMPAVHSAASASPGSRPRRVLTIRSATATATTTPRATPHSQIGTGRVWIGEDAAAVSRVHLPGPAVRTGGRRAARPG